MASPNVHAPRLVVIATGMFPGDRYLSARQGGDKNGRERDEGSGDMDGAAVIWAARKMTRMERR